MQIDFHHGVTYICARLAGFGGEEAEIIAYSAQYVDDATNGGEINFDNGAIYSRIASAHKMLDYRNMSDLAAHRVWLPFHFLPGNAGETESENPPVHSADEFIRRCTCRPDSHVARRMMFDVIRQQDRPYALHRLGIASHVYFDTWAHQGFVGFQHDVNVVKDIVANDEKHRMGFREQVKEFFRENWDSAKSELVGGVLSLGHGAALSYPDRPYLRWTYTNGLGDRIERNNPQDFNAAAENLYAMFRRYLDYRTEGDGALDNNYLLPDAFHSVRKSIEEIDDENAEVRHARRLKKIASGEFSFADSVGYVPKGGGSWKYAALATTASDRDENPYTFTEGFSTSNWKKFHDALQVHRLYILSDLLPRFGLIAA
ncbi:DUF6765 family protein [Herbaspirillum camelliae]|uniref:DUF6765 family protein n=1 Tax=Herbaspirillum camelliae TaxID=1892903 RepID=UPI000949CBEB|nr:DUF6765 family protein [Herbaspirillum camelliae]